MKGFVFIVGAVSALSLVLVSTAASADVTVVRIATIKRDAELACPAAVFEKDGVEYLHEFAGRHSYTADEALLLIAMCDVYDHGAAFGLNHAKG